MHASAILAFAAAGLAAAAPTANTGDKGKFFVNKFVFGCTSGCYYSFNLSFQNDAQFQCSGSLEDKDYVECKGEVDTESYYAYIDTTEDKNILKLQFEVSNSEEGTVTRYYGEDQVYAVTSSDADKQEESFSVGVSSVTAVA
jgi:hypothetical protein